MSTSTSTTEIPGAKLIPLVELRPGGDINARKAESDITGLKKSIDTHGLLVPLIVRKADGKKGGYLVVAGNRRLRAITEIVKAAKGSHQLNVVPCVETNLDGVAALEISAIENLDREGLHPVDEFEVYAALVESGNTVEDIARKRGMRIAQVRQALAIGRMSVVVRDGWRAGKVSAEVSEALCMTSDHKAQEAALKKVGKQGNAWQVRRALLGSADDGFPREAQMLKIVGKPAYEAAGHQVNETLFTERDGTGEMVVSDLPALKAMTEAKLEARCEELVAAGWKWAMTKMRAPKDWTSWRRADVQHNATKDQKAECGCVIGFHYDNTIKIVYGIVKPGDKGVSIPKSPRQKKAAAKQREERKEESGGISNALAYRLSQQLTEAVRASMSSKNIASTDALSIAIAVLACENEATPHLKLAHFNYDDKDGDGRDENEFGKYFKLADSKSTAERTDLLMTWVAKAVDLTAHDGGELTAFLSPGKDDDKAAREIVECINEGAYTRAALKAFDAADYFASVNKELLAEAVTEALGKEHGAKVAKMGKAEAVKFATANVKDWLPPALRHPNRRGGK